MGPQPAAGRSRTSTTTSRAWSGCTGTGRGVSGGDLANADLAATKSDAPDPVVSGTDLTYTIQVTNQGPDHAQNATMREVLPRGMTFGGLTHPAGWSCTTPPFGHHGIHRVHRAPDAPGDGDLQHRGPRGRGPPSGTVLADTVEAWSAAFDVHQADNSATALTTVNVVADADIESLAAVDLKREAIGDHVDLTIRKSFANRGPSAPIDIRVTRTGSASPGATVTPASAGLTVSGVDDDGIRVLDETFTVSCQAPGPHTFTFTNTFALADPNAVDPDHTNDSATTTVIWMRGAGDHQHQARRLPQCPQPEGQSSVAVLTTGAGEYGLPLAFDATHPAAHRPVRDERRGLGGRRRLERDPRDGPSQGQLRADEVTQDGDIDMLLHFALADSGLTQSSTEGCVWGMLAGGGGTYAFFGCDSVKVSPP